MAILPSIVSVREATELLSLSRARLYKLIEENRIATEDFLGQKVITLREINRFKQVERKPGRPRLRKNGGKVK